MAWIIPGLMGLVLLALLLFVMMGARALKQVPGGVGYDPELVWPPVALIVPVTGAAPGLADNLRSLLTQDYADYEVVFAVRDRLDPAAPVIEALLQGRPRARLVVSGPAEHCGQKNHNLLAGLHSLDGRAEILAFGDANQQAPPSFLKALVEPVASGRAEVTSGYHHVMAQDEEVATLGRAVAALILYLTKPFRRLNQPWGGATAIRRSLFEELEVERLWAETVVDDVSLAALLQKARIPVLLAPGASLETYLQGETLSDWQDWLTRQWLYLKFYLPGTWAAAGLAIFLVNFLVLAALLYLLGAAWRWDFSPQALIGVMFVGLLGALGDMLRTIHPRPSPLKTWLTAFYLTVALAARSHLKTWFARDLTWRGITYRVAPGGKVTGIEEG